MPRKKEPELVRLAYAGQAFQVEFYVRRAGEALAEEWLESMPASGQQKFAALFAWMGDHGRILNERKFKHLTGTNQIFEFKSEDGRVLCFFFSGRRIILTHGFKKQGDKTPKKEIELAEKLKAEFEERTKLWTRKNEQ